MSRPMDPVVGRTLGTIVLLAIAAIAVVLIFGRARAHSHGEHADWYRSLKRPDYPWISCCNEQDCAPVDARTSGDCYEVRLTRDGAWLPVPPAAVLQHKANPTGSAVACVQRGVVICFVRATET